MANATITVLEADGVTSTDVVVLDVGRQAAAASKSTAMSTEDKAVLDAMAASLAIIDNASTAVTTINGVAAAFGSGSTGATVLRTTLATDSPGVTALGQTTASASLPVTIASDQSTVQVETDIKYVDVTLSLHTNAGEALDLLADAQIVAACTRANDVESLLQSLVVIDEDDNGAVLKIIFLSASTTLGSEGAALGPADSVAREILGIVDIAAADYMDGANWKVASKNNLGIVIKPASGTDDCYVAVQLVSGTPTFSASGIRLRMGFI
jgi:hypothetical protein